jgi:polyhydroxyalkanoate synthesis regulator phasin
MDTNTNPSEDNAKDIKDQSHFLKASRKAFLIGIGAFAFAHDAMEDFVEKLLERGEIAEKDGRRLYREVMDRREKTAQQAGEKMGTHVERILEHLNVPTKADVASLHEKIASLTQKIDELNQGKNRP